MFDIGFWEILLILVLALVVIGPERLPGAARTLGLWVGKARRYVEGVKGEVEQEFDLSEFKRVIHNQEIQLKELQQKINRPASVHADELLAPKEPSHDIREEPRIEETSTAAETKADSQKDKPE